MFVTATPDDKLLKMLKETESKYIISNDFRIKYVPKAGIKLMNLSRSGLKIKIGVYSNSDWFQNLLEESYNQS